MILNINFVAFSNLYSTAFSTAFHNKSHRAAEPMLYLQSRARDRATLVRPQTSEPKKLESQFRLSLDTEPEPRAKNH